MNSLSTFIDSILITSMQELRSSHASRNRGRWRSHLQDERWGIPTRGRWAIYELGHVRLADGRPREQREPCHTVFFFFSSRRRHTRLQGDWSSDVCSSD